MYISKFDSKNFFCLFHKKLKLISLQTGWPAHPHHHLCTYILNTSWTIEFQTELPIILMIKTKSYCFIVMSKLGCWLGPAASSSHWQDNGMDYWQWWKWIFPLHNEIWRKSMREREKETFVGALLCVCVDHWENIYETTCETWYVSKMLIPYK